MVWNIASRKNLNLTCPTASAIADSAGLNVQELEANVAEPTPDGVGQEGLSNGS